MKVGVSGKPKDPFSVVLDTLRAQLKNGQLVSGEPLTITDLAHDLGLSATPVREALSRLAGERLIEDRRGRGYFAPRLDVSDLVEFYGLRRLYLGEALAAATNAITVLSADEAQSPLPAAAQLTQLLDQVVARAGNQALFDAYRQVGERLAPCVRVEAMVFPVADELASIETSLADKAALASAIFQLHEARRLGATNLMRAMRAGANIASL